MLLQEIFDTDINIKPEDWQENGRFLMVSFIINQQGYTIQLERKPIEGIQNAAEVSFFRNDVEDSEVAFSTTNNQPRSLLVYGIVANAIPPIADRFDALLIVAERRHSSSEKEYQTKQRIYNSLVQIITRIPKFSLYTIPEEYERNQAYTRWLVSKIPPETGSRFRDEQKIALEMHIVSTTPFVV